MKTEGRFTRMDLAVVLFCIVFLFMNLGAISGGARRRAKKLVCLSNLRTWGKVFQMYAEDNDGSTISDEMFNEKWGYTPYEGVPAGECWMSLLMNSYEDEQLLLCPMATKGWGGNFEFYGHKYRAWDFPPSHGFPEGGIGSYGINDWCYNPPPQQEDGPWGFPLENCWRTVNVSGADEIPLFMDCIHIGFFCEAWVGGGVQVPPYFEDRPNIPGYALGFRRICMDRHGNGTTNGLFLDGSVRSVGLKELWTLRFAKDGGCDVWDTCNMFTICGGATSEDWDEWAPWMKDFKDY